MVEDRLLRRTAVSTAAQLAQGLRGLFPLLVARLLGAPALGLTSLAWSWVDLLSKLAIWGLDQATTIAVAAEATATTTAGGRRLLRVAAVRAVSRALAVAAVLNVLVALGAVPQPVRAVALLAWALPFVALFRVANAASWGAGSLHHNIVSKGLTEASVTVLLLIALVGLGAEWRAPLLAIIGGYAAAAAVAVVLARRVLDQVPATGSDAGDGLRRARWIGGSDLLYIANMRLDVLALGAFATVGLVDLTTLGAYGAAVEIGFAAKKVRSIFEPILLRDLSAGAVADAQRARVWQIVLQLGAFGALWLAMPLLLALFGESFRAAVPWARLLLVANILNGLLSTDAAMNVMAPAVNVRVGAAGLLLGAVLSAVLIPAWGAAGAAVAITLSYGVQAAWRLRVLGAHGLPAPWSALRPAMLRAGTLLAPMAAVAWWRGPDVVAAAVLAILYILLYGVWMALGAGDLAEIGAAIRRSTR